MTDKDEIQAAMDAAVKYAYKKGQQDGALAMREKCAQACTARVMGDCNREDQEARRCAAAIRGIEP